MAEKLNKEEVWTKCLSFIKSRIQETAFQTWFDDVRVSSINREDISSDIIEREKEIYADQASQSGKPDNIIDKMIEGRMNKFYQDNVLLEQAFVKDPDKNVQDIITDTIAKLGENIVVSRFVRFQLGELINKSSSNNNL